MSPRPTNTTPLEDTDVLRRTALPATKRALYRLRADSRKARPIRLTRESEKAILHNACWVFGYLALFIVAVWLVNGGAQVVTDADIYGPDELYHAQAGRYGYE